MKYARFLPKIVYSVSSFFGRINDRITESYVQYKCTGYCQTYKVVFDPYKVLFHGMPRLWFDDGCRVEFKGEFMCNSGVGGGTIDNHLFSQIHVYSTGTLTVGDKSGISNACIHCMDRIDIGNYVNIGAGAMIIDTDFHSLDWKDKRDGIDVQKAAHAPVTIKDFAFIGANALIMKGVTIGEKARVGAGSVVTKNIPDGEIWAGNPAKKIGTIIDNE